MDTYLHLLESFLNILASASSNLLRIIFQQELYPNIFQPDLNIELRIYLIRFTEKIITICQGDVNIPEQFVSSLITQLEFQFQPQGAQGDGTSSKDAQASQSQGAGTSVIGSGGSKVATTNYQYHVQKLWETIKFKYLMNIDSVQLDQIIGWIAKSLYQLTESETTEASDISVQQFNLLFHLTELVNIVCMRASNNMMLYQRRGILMGADLVADGNVIENQLETNEMSSNSNCSNIVMKYFMKLSRQDQGRYLVCQNQFINLQVLVEPLKECLQYALQYQTKLEVFKAVWQALVEVISLSSPPGECSLRQIAQPLLDNVVQYCKYSSPRANMLYFILTILETIKEFEADRIQMSGEIKDFLFIFIDCIPHSVCDETFQVFDLLISIVSGMMDERLIQVRAARSVATLAPALSPMLATALAAHACPHACRPYPPPRRSADASSLLITRNASWG